jgi:TetR/AcrR family transcriptional repressor for divergent bdcA
MIKTFVAGSRPDVAQEVTDFVSSVMSGLSASAREGMSQARLLNIAHAASFGLTGLLKGNERIGAD